MPYVSKLLNDADNPDFATWIQGGDMDDGTYRWRLVHTVRPYRVSYIGNGTGATYVGTLEKSFTIDRAAGKAIISLTGLTNTRSGGKAKLVVELIGPSGTTELLNVSGGTGVSERFLEEEDIKDYMQAAGAYLLRFTATVKKHDVAASSVGISYLHLQVDEAVEWELELNEDVSVTETFIQGLSFVEDVSVKEFFFLAKTTPYAPTDKKLLCAKTDSKVYEFDEGTPEGTFDTRDEDFGLPGQEKTLSEIHFSSSAEAPHTVSVYVSTDAGLTWVPYGRRVISKGVIGIIFPWGTEEAFSVRFKGAGLHLDSFTLYAIPRGQEAPVSD